VFCWGGAVLVVAAGSMGRANAVSAGCAAGIEVHNHSGCTANGHYLATTATVPSDCCAKCASDSLCNAWTFHAAGERLSPCYLATVPKVATNSGTASATCGCRSKGCTAPPPPPAVCDPVKRPPKPTPAPLPPGKTQPHIVTVLVDDLGFDDASIRRGADKGITYTPHLQTLAENGIVLDRHHTYLWCSPTRRAFLTGRYPIHITGTQAPTCSNLTPLQFTVLSEKLASVGYEAHFVGKGHLGWWTTDHLMVNRGFTSHLGFLGGGESYTHGELSRCGDGGKADMWLNDGPASGLVGGDYYNTNFFTQYALGQLAARNTSKPWWLHLTHQAVHTGANRSPPSWEQWPGVGNEDYVSALYVLDGSIANLTAALKTAGMWDNTVFFLTADNGGDCGLPAQGGGRGGAPGYASNYPLLGRKCTAWDGGTRTAAFVSGGLVPPPLRGTRSSALIYVTDWYPTLCRLAGVDPTDDWVDGNGTAHPIDGVDVWPALMGGSNATGRPWLPTTERSLLWDDGAGHMYKLITSENQANRFHENGSQYMDPFNGCLDVPDTAGPAITADRVGVPPSCTVCTPEKPCLFDVLADPTERANLATTLPTVAATMAAKLATYVPYVPSLTPANLACYICEPSSTAAPKLWWQNFSGPCCIAKSWPASRTERRNLQPAM